MPHTHHSHSGQFCNHAVDELAVVLDHAFDQLHMSSVALTEHVPRPAEHLYPGEATSGWDPAGQVRIFDAFVAEAVRLRAAAAERRGAADATAEQQQRQVLVGFEGEWIDADAAAATARLQGILTRFPGTFDFWIGSVHHVAGQPIDFDAATYERAAELSGGEEGLWCAYFDAQFALLQAMRPPVVGHFDLIRLKSSAPDRDLRSVAAGAVWARVMRNLQAVKAYGGVLEVNSSGLRKGLAEPYPRREVLRAWRNMDGDVVLSDDSHGVAQVGACYEGVIATLEACGFRQVGVLERGADGDAGRPAMARVELEELRKHAFWAAR